VQDWSGVSIVPSKILAVLKVDSSPTGAGGTFFWRKSSRKEKSVSIRLTWDQQESTMSQNNRELRGVLRLFQAHHARIAAFTAQSLSPHWPTLKIQSDNSTAVAYINHQGGRTPLLSDMAVTLWEEATAIKLRLSGEHIPGVMMEGLRRVWHGGCNAL
jgi:hypothetical protein